jgi:hypothetical protein
MTECAVCLEGFNKSTRAPSECPHCHTKVCRTCFQFYLLNDISDLPRCVNPECGQGWQREFIDSESTRTFRLQTYKEHREKVLSDRERARLPATQEEAAAVKSAKDTVEATALEVRDLTRQIFELQRKLTDAETKRHHAQQVLYTWGRYRMPVNNEIQTTSVPKRAEPVAFVRACPAPDCKGFLSTAWKCGLCNQWSCPDCHELKGLQKDCDHTCDPTKVASARLIDRESKPCPKCGARISKIDGCDQMWCTQCNTGFNWRTGKVADGPVHNPHYFEYLRRTGQAPAAAGAGAGAGAMGVNCDHETDRQVSRALAPYNASGYYTRRDRHPIDDYLLEAWRRMREAQDPYNRQADVNVEEAYRVARVRYMLDDLTEDEWKSILQRIEKDSHFQRAKQDVRELFVAATRDLIRQVLNPEANKKDIVRQVSELITYCNTCYEAIGKRFGRKAPKIEISEPPPLT